MKTRAQQALATAKRLALIAGRALARIFICAHRGCEDECSHGLIEPACFYACRHCGRDAYTGETLEQWLARDTPPLDDETRDFLDQLDEMDRVGERC